MVETISRKKTQVDQLKRPPHSFEAEQAIIGGLMLDNQVSSFHIPILVSSFEYRASRLENTEGSTFSLHKRTP